MKDQGLQNPNLFLLIRAESSRQIEKWGFQDRSPFEWVTYTAEELGEMADAISEYEYRNGDPGDVVTEAIQAATLCLKVAEMFLMIQSQKAAVI